MPFFFLNGEPLALQAVWAHECTFVVVNMKGTPLLVR